MMIKKIIRKFKRLGFYFLKFKVFLYNLFHHYEKYVAIISCNEWKNKVWEDLSLKYYLNKKNIGVDIISFEEDNDYSKYSALIIKSIWGFQKKKEIFDLWLENINNKNIKLFNSYSIIKDNYDKERQFAILDKYNIPHVDTIFIDNVLDINKFSSKFDKFVIKPVISESGNDTYMVGDCSTDKNSYSVDEIMIKYKDNPYKLMIQPFISSVKDGEYSVVCFGGKVSHIICRSVSVFNDISYIRDVTDDVDSNMLKIVNKIIQIKEYKDCLYMRIDLVKDIDKYLVMEVELLDPQLFLNSISCKEKRKKAYNCFVKEIVSKL